MPVDSPVVIRPWEPRGRELVERLLRMLSEHAVVSSIDAVARFPGVAAHLRSCEACRADHDGLLEAAALFGDALDAG